MPRTDKSNASRNGQFRYIDFHTHILPNIDDGSKSLDESLKMLDMSFKSQVYCSVLTPHFYPTHDSISAFLYKRNQAFDKLKSSMTQNYPLLRVGAEVQYFNGISQTDELEKLKIVGTELILIEMPFTRWTDEMLTEIFAVNERPGFHVVLAHIERYLSFMPDGALDPASLPRLNHTIERELLHQFLHQASRARIVEIWIYHAHRLGLPQHHDPSPRASRLL